MALTLGQKQRAFTIELARLIVWAHGKGYEFTLSDGNIDPFRVVRLTDKSVHHRARDLVHKEDGLHYRRLAQDLNLFVKGEWISTGGHPAWKEVGEKWETMNPLARWGGRFGTGDDNHVSFTDGGQS